MPETKRSKSTGSTTWVLQRVTGVVLILLLLAHFWVHHFFISEFYGEMNVIKMPVENPSVTQQLQEWNPMFGQLENTYIAPVNKELQKSAPELYLHQNRVSDTVAVTVIDGSRQTAMVHGHHSDPEILQQQINWSIDEATLRQLTVDSKHFSTKTMINYGDVQARVANIWWKAYNLLFLILGLYHGFIGVWDVILDYKMGSLTRVILWGMLWTFAIILFIVGMLIIVPMGM